uniref:Transposon TX1 uncharacterized n=1 Tax=Rhizophora mucronata TaxID=61149 RepID=A0A2P2J494_RHIMU
MVGTRLKITDDLLMRVALVGRFLAIPQLAMAWSWKSCKRSLPNAWHRIGHNLWDLRALEFSSYLSSYLYLGFSKYSFYRLLAKIRRMVSLCCVCKPNTLLPRAILV